MRFYIFIWKNLLVSKGKMLIAYCRSWRRIRKVVCKVFLACVLLPLLFTQIVRDDYGQNYKEIRSSQNQFQNNFGNEKQRDHENKNLFQITTENNKYTNTFNAYNFRSTSQLELSNNRYHKNDFQIEKNTLYRRNSTLFQHKKSPSVQMEPRPLIQHQFIALPKHNISDYFTNITNSLRCYRAGTNLHLAADSWTKCDCRDNFHGSDCGIPPSAWYTKYRRKLQRKELSLRAEPRRIINAFPFNHEFDLLESRVNELRHVVDVFILLESNVSTFGEPKPLRFYERFRNGFLKDVMNKFIYLHVHSFPEEARLNGWVAEEYIRYLLGQDGLNRINGLRDDDIFILSDADEIPSKETVNFLRFYDGYHEPIIFKLKWSIYGFFWKWPSSKFFGLLSNILAEQTTVRSACSIKMFREVYRQNAYLIRDMRIMESEEFLENYKRYQASKTPWTMGTATYYAGWHCSWCFRPEDIVIKMDSAQKEDKPRWGDFPEKKNLTYIKNNIRKGIWFDGVTTFLKSNSNEPMFAPPYILEHPRRFKYLLENR